MKTKYIPNVLGFTRIVLNVGIIFSAMLGEIFGWYTMTLFVIAGLTDIFDGPIARRVKDGRSELGASLDAIADLFMIIVGIAIFIPAMGLWSNLMVIIILAITFKITIPIGIAAIKYKEFMSLHTYSFKFLSSTMFSTPILYFIFLQLGIPTLPFFNIWFTIVAILAYTFIIEEIVIILATNRPCRDIKSIFTVKKFNAYEGGEKIGNMSSRAENDEKE